MLADRDNIDTLPTSMPEFYLETKLDGERIQLHKKGSSYRYWSRNATEYTYLYGATPFEGSLTPSIHDLFHERVKDCILDGEMVVMDTEKGEIMPFGTLKGVAAMPSLGGKLQPCCK